MGQVLIKLEALLEAKKQYSLNCKRLRESGKYSDVYLQKEISKLKSELENNICKTLQEVGALIDAKAATLISTNTKTNDATYQQLIANTLTKINMMGDNLTIEVLKSLIDPIIEAKDTETIEVIRAFVRNINDDCKKFELLNIIPVVQDERKKLDSWKQSIYKNFSGVDYNLNDMPIEEIMLIQMKDTIIADI